MKQEKTYLINIKLEANDTSFYAIKFYN